MFVEPALTMPILKTFIFLGREIKNKWSAEAISQWIVTTLPPLELPDVKFWTESAWKT